MHLIKGKIVYEADQKPLVEVNIFLENNPRVGTTSNDQGVFNLKIFGEIFPNDTIVFSHVSYKEKKFSLKELEKKVTKITLKKLSIHEPTTVIYKFIQK